MLTQGDYAVFQCAFHQYNAYKAQHHIEILRFLLNSIITKGETLCHI